MSKQVSPAEDGQRNESSQQNNTSRRRLLHFLGASAIAGLAGCSAGNKTSTETATDTEKGAETGKELRQSATIGVRMPVANGVEGRFNYDNWGGVAEYYTRIFEPLTWATRDLKVKPNLATEWRATGEKTWEFDIRDGVTFHNGKPLNAEAVVFSLKKMLSLYDYVPKWSKTKPEGVRKVDDMTIEVENTRPYPGFPGHMTHLNFVIQHPDRTMGNPIGTGPYKFEEKEKGHHLTVSAFEDYWADTPQMKELTYRVIPDRNTRALALEGDRIDLGMELPTSQFEAINKSDNTVAVSQTRPKPVWLTFENTKPTTDIKLRKALNYAISQKKVVEGSQNDIGVPARGPVPNIVWWSMHDSLPKFGPNKAKAKTLVEESSYNGETLQLLAESDSQVPSPKLIGQIVQQQAKDVGVDIEVKMMGGGAYNKAEKNNEGNIYLTEDSIPFAGSLYIFNLDPTRNYLKGFEGFKDVEKVRSLAAKGLEAKKREVKKDALGEAQQILMKNAYIVPLFYEKYVNGKDKNFGKYAFHPFPTNQAWENLKFYK